MPKIDAGGDEKHVIYFTWPYNPLLIFWGKCTIPFLCVPLFCEIHTSINQLFPILIFYFVNTLHISKVLLISLYIYIHIITWFIFHLFSLVTTAWISNENKTCHLIVQTTLGHIIAQRAKASGKIRFVQLSATTANVSTVKETITAAANEQRMTKRKTILFIDEIHRFNKAQQVDIINDFSFNPLMYCAFAIELSDLSKPFKFARLKGFERLENSLTNGTYETFWKVKQLSEQTYHSPIFLPFKSFQRVLKGVVVQ